MSARPPDNDPEQESPCVRAPSSAGPRRVLLAEDNPVNQLLVVRLLHKQGHTVVVAGNGREAIEALEKEWFDVVLMDMGMPVLDGLQATTAIRQKEWGTEGHVRIIALTAYPQRDYRERCLAAGMDGYLAKPVRSEDLLVALNGSPTRGALAGTHPQPAPGPLAGASPDRREALAREGGDRVAWSVAGGGLSLVR
jgi:CheY-like chemotaxis protein